MLPMNKICEDIKAFLIRKGYEEAIVAWSDEKRKAELVLFANRLSEKHGDHVDIKLVQSLIVSIQKDSIEKDEKNAI